MTGSNALSAQGRWVGMWEGAACAMHKKSPVTKERPTLADATKKPRLFTANGKLAVSNPFLNIQIFKPVITRFRISRIGQT